jgi:uncharacterized protein YxjI
VRLYFAETFHTSDGQRVFDVSIEGTTVLDDYDIHADVGHDTGTVKTFTVTPDSTLDVDFSHVTENPKVSAIEVVPVDGTGDTDTEPTGSSTVDIIGEGTEADYEFGVSGEVTGGESLNPTDSFSGNTASGTVIGGTDTYTITGELTSLTVDGTATVEVDGQEIDPATVGSGDTAPTGSSDAIYRVNAGGSQLSASDGGPDWAADTGASPSGDTNAGAANSKTFTTSDSVSTTGSVSSGTPTEVFESERYDLSSGDEMQWNIPVEGGQTYEVRLYFAETFHTSDGQRVFDVSIEGTTVLDDYDIHADVGHDTGVVKSFTVESSPELDIDFSRETGNPKVVAIEIVPVDG